jgi:hypothetical protein
VPWPCWASARPIPSATVTTDRTTAVTSDSFDTFIVALLSIHGRICWLIPRCCFDVERPSLYTLVMCKTMSLTQTCACSGKSQRFPFRVPARSPRMESSRSIHLNDCDAGLEVVDRRDERL